MGWETSGVGGTVAGGRGEAGVKLGKMGVGRSSEGGMGKFPAVRGVARGGGAGGRGVEERWGGHSAKGV